LGDELNEEIERLLSRKVLIKMVGYSSAIIY
jgi:hypothetical protein